MRFLFKAMIPCECLASFSRPSALYFCKSCFFVCFQVPMTSSSSSIPGTRFTPRNPTGQFWSSSHTLFLAEGRPWYAGSHRVYKLYVGGRRTHLFLQTFFLFFFFPLVRFAVCIDELAKSIGKGPPPWTRRGHAIESGRRDAQ